jgi:predicted RNase H-like nuclease (RuvC/YqgF family)
MIPGAPENKRRDSISPPEGDRPTTPKIPGDHYLSLYAEAIQDIQRLKRENERLKAKITELEDEVLMLKDLIREENR